MFRLNRLSTLVDEASSGIKLIFIIIALIGALAGAMTAGKAIVAMPGKLDQHSGQSQIQTDILREMLCIQISDHQHSDWTNCLTNASH